MSRQDKKELEQLNQELNQELSEYAREHEGDMGKDKKTQPKRKKKKGKLWKKILVVLLVLIIAAVLGVAGLFAMGKGSLFKDLVNMKDTINGAKTEDNGDLIVYNGEKYRYNKDVTSILCMGIDNEEIADDETLKEKGAGQADSIFLIVIDTKKNKTTLLNISRDSEVDINVYDENREKIASNSGYL